MEASKFEPLLRRAVEQTTRREMLGVLLGGMLLLHRRDEIEATEKASWCRKRQRRQGR